MGKLHQSAELLRDARKRGYGIPAYNTINYETTRMVFDAAERAKTPVIIMYYVTPALAMDTFAQMVKSVGEKSSVPFALHLDHSPSFELCMKAIHAGFTSVMIDASKKPFEENIAETRKVVESAHAMDVDVEGELGMVGREQTVDRTRFTQPDEAQAFIERSGIDALAVAIGNSHGLYVDEPNLDIELLKRLNAAVSVPLVMHGTSLIPADQLKEAVRHGIVKTNIATEYWIYYKDVVTKLINGENPPKNIITLLRDAQEPVTEFIAQKMAVLNPDNVSIL